MCTSILAKAFRKYRADDSNFDKALCFCNKQPVLSFLDADLFSLLSKPFIGARYSLNTVPVAYANKEMSNRSSLIFIVTEIKTETSNF
jgi:hypothetical protein